MIKTSFKTESGKHFSNNVYVWINGNGVNDCFVLVLHDYKLPAI